MGLFSKNKKRTLPEVLGIRLSDYPNENFEEIEEEINTANQTMFSQTGYFNNNKILDLFSIVTIKTFKETTGKNFIFSCDPDEEIDRNALKYLVNQIYALYGMDEISYGKFQRHDWEEVEEGFWSGRMWTDNNYPMDCMISFNEEDGLSFTIWTS